MKPITEEQFKSAKLLIDNMDRMAWHYGFGGTYEGPVLFDSVEPGSGGNCVEINRADAAEMVCMKILNWLQDTLGPVFRAFEVHIGKRDWEIRILDQEFESVKKFAELGTLETLLACCRVIHQKGIKSYTGE